MLSCFLLILIGTTAGDQGWKTVERGVKIDYDLEGTPLEIKTDSKLGSDEWVDVWFYSAGGDVAGRVELYFESAVEYQLGYCTFSNLPTAPPSTVNKVWKITLTRSSGVRVKIHCNGVEVLNLLLSDSTCRYSSSWSTYWNRDVEQIWFRPSDKASDKYRPDRCTGLKTSWTNMVADEKFPVAVGTKVNLSCKAGYQLTGDKTVTCDGTFTLKFSEEPQCVKCSAGTYRDSKATSCTKCPENKVTEQDGAISCTSCAAGQVSNEERTKCEACSTGHYRTNYMTTCEPCEDGKEVNSDKTSCVVCAAGTFKDSTVISCTKCPENKITIQDGATSCTSCATGQVSNEERTKCVGCTGLKTEWIGSIKTTTKFPVVPGTVVKVECSDPEPLNKGSIEVTCTSETDYSYKKEPRCAIIGKFSILNLGIISSFNNT